MKPVSYTSSSDEIEVLVSKKSETEELESKELIKSNSEFKLESPISVTTLEKQSKSFFGKLKWIALSSFALFIFSELLFSLYQSFQASSFLFILQLILIGVVLIYLTFECLNFFRFKRLLNLRRARKNLIQKSISSKSPVEVIDYLSDISKELSFGDLKKIEIQSSNHLELIELFELNVLKIKDDNARKIISHCSSRTALWIGLSPLASLDLLVMFYQSLRMIKQISKEYGLPSSFVGDVRILKRVFEQMMLVGAQEMAIDFASEVLGPGLGAKVSARVGQGLGAGFLSLRFGLKIMQECRPIELQLSSSELLSGMRKQLISDIKSKLKGNYDLEK